MDNFFCSAFRIDLKSLVVSILSHSTKTVYTAIDLYNAVMYLHGFSRGKTKGGGFTELLPKYFAVHIWLSIYRQKGKGIEKGGRGGV